MPILVLEMYRIWILIILFFSPLCWGNEVCSLGGKDPFKEFIGEGGVKPQVAGDAPLEGSIPAQTFVKVQLKDGTELQGKVVADAGDKLFISTGKNQNPIPISRADIEPKSIFKAK